MIGAGNCIPNIWVGLHKMKKNYLVILLLVAISLISSCGPKLICIADIADYSDPQNVVDNAPYIFVAKVNKKGKKYEKGMAVYFKYDFENVQYIQNTYNYQNTKLEVISDSSRDDISKIIVGYYSLFIGKQFSDDDITPLIFKYNPLEGFNPTLSLVEQNESVLVHYMKYINIIEQV